MLTTESPSEGPASEYYHTGVGGVRIPTEESEGNPKCGPAERSLPPSLPASSSQVLAIVLLYAHNTAHSDLMTAVKQIWALGVHDLRGGRSVSAVTAYTQGQ